jgi:hypothetical protein
MVSRKKEPNIIYVQKIRELFMTLLLGDLKQKVKDEG